jgi:hypothetical protein
MAVSSNLAYGFWERALRKGSVILVVSASYMTPLFSTIVSSAYLRVGVGLRLWLGCALAVLGAALCNVMAEGEGRVATGVSSLPATHKHEERPNGQDTRRHRWPLRHRQPAL